MHTSKISKKYIGIDKELHGGMTPIAKMIRDAWVFGILPEDETCEGWTLGAIEGITEKVNAEWDKYGCLVSHLPEDLQKRHHEIHGKAIEKAKQAGWDGTNETKDDD
jgi:hypothetical protein